MLFLVFRLGEERCALEARQVAEVLPFVRIKAVPQAPRGVAGVFDLRGTPVPVIDLSELTVGRPAQRRLSTRLIIVRYPNGQHTTRLLGLIAEQATEIVRREPADFVDSGIATDHAPYLGPVAIDASGLLQRIVLDRVLPPSVRDVLFRSPVDEPWPSPPSQAC